MSAPTCKQCGKQIGDSEVRFEKVRYPFSPDWQVTREDAGLFCSTACLREYEHDDDQVEVNDG